MCRDEVYDHLCVKEKGCTRYEGKMFNNRGTYPAKGVGQKGNMRADLAIFRNFLLLSREKEKSGGRGGKISKGKGSTMSARSGIRERL